MADETMEVTMDRMADDVDSMGSLLRQTRGHIRDLSSAMENLDQMWRGPANRVMQQRFQRDLASLQDLCGLLEELRQIMNRMRCGYDACETDVRAAVDGIRLSL